MFQLPIGFPENVHGVERFHRLDGGVGYQLRLQSEHGTAILLRENEGKVTRFHLLEHGGRGVCPDGGLLVRPGAVRRVQDVRPDQSRPTAEIRRNDAALRSATILRVSGPGGTICLGCVFRLAEHDVVRLQRAVSCRLGGLHGAVACQENDQPLDHAAHKSYR